MFSCDCSFSQGTSLLLPKQTGLQILLCLSMLSYFQVEIERTQLARQCLSVQLPKPGNRRQLWPILLWYAGDSLNLWGLPVYGPVNMRAPHHHMCAKRPQEEFGLKTLVQSQSTAGADLAAGDENRDRRKLACLRPSNLNAGSPPVF